MELSDREIKLLLAAGKLFEDQFREFPNSHRNWMFAAFALSDDRMTEDRVEIEEEDLDLVKGEIEKYKAFVAKAEEKKNSKIMRVQ